jgi:hypothetical protein
MGASPRFKIFTADKEYIGSTKYVEDAAAVVALNGDGATIRDGHSKVVWTEGPSGDGSAAESYDAVAIVVDGRVVTPIPTR